MELAQREFPGFEVVVATHVDTNHLHNHLVVNSVSCTTGKKLHQSADDLLAHRQANDEICAAYGLSVLDVPEKQRSKLWYDVLLIGKEHYGEYQKNQQQEAALVRSRVFLRCIAPTC